ncbi:MAG TPA: hypothetical protein VFP85_15095 [Vicinamibacterales bacterium]|nr:hypothetical protein [Vicinamibacterales bacterium]
MTKHHSATLAVLALLLAACNQVETSPPGAVASAKADPLPPPVDQKPLVKPGNVSPSDTLVGADGQPVNQLGAATLEFHKRVQAYVKIHKEADGKVPSLKRTDDPVEIATREKGLADMIMTLRAGAQPGDIFAKEYQPYFIKMVQDDFKERPAADRRALVQELPKNLKVDVNTVYPTTLPLATFPPKLLRKLPDLPPELEYRIVGRSLILRDVKANLIVDILRDVVPTIPT